MNRTLLSLAIIKVNWETNRVDYIQNFVPLIGSLIKQKGYETIEISTLQNDFLVEYGLKIPQYPLISILKRMTKQEYLEKNYEKYVVKKSKILELNLPKIADKISQSYELLINELCQYCENEFDTILSASEVEEAFLSFLSDFDLDILFATSNQSTLPQFNKSKKLKFIVSNFILNSFQTDKPVFSIISDISIGYSLAQSILYSELNSYSGKLSQLNFYLDTPFIINLLGFNGDHKRNSSEELIQILNEEKVNLFLLQTNLDEIESILNDCFKHLDKGDFRLEKASKVLRYCYRNEVTSSDVEQVVLKLKDLLSAYNIYYDKVPDYDVANEYQIDEELLTNTIFETYKVYAPDLYPAEFEMKGTIRRDVKVLSGMYKLRQGNKPRTIKDAKHIFITTNSALAYASRKFELKGSNGHTSIPVCLTDVFVGTLIWLQSPMKVEQLNQKKLIADCYASLQPNELLINKFLLEVEKSRKQKRITSDDYYLLRSDRATISLLEQYTFNDPDLFDDGTTEEILNRIVNRIREEEIAKLEKERIEHEGTKIKVERLELAYDKLNQEKNILPEKLSRVIGYSIFYLLIIVFVSALTLSFLSSSLDLNVYIIVTLWFVVSVFTFLNLYNGFSFKRSREKTIKYFYKIFVDMSIK